MAKGTNTEVQKSGKDVCKPQMPMKDMPMKQMPMNK